MDRRTDLTTTPAPDPNSIGIAYSGGGPLPVVITAFQPLAGWRRVEVTIRRAHADFAEQMRRLVDQHFREAETIRVVLDNLSTHTPVARYETLAPEMTRRPTRRLELEHTSWLNMVEIARSILARQCLDRRLALPHD